MLNDKNNSLGGVPYSISMQLVFFIVTDRALSNNLGSSLPFYGKWYLFSNVDLQPRHYILSQIPDSTVEYDLCMDVGIHLGCDGHYHHYLLVLLHHDIH